MRKEKEENKKRLDMATISGMLFGAAVGIWIAWRQEDSPLVWVLPFIFIAAYLQILIHETGHLVAGLLSGYRFGSFRIGGLILLSVDGKLRLRRISIAGTGGQNLMVPPEMENGTFPYLLYNLGGPLFNLLSVPICAGLGVLTRDSFLASTFWNLCALLGLYMALLNGIPMRLGMVNNDGYNARELGKQPDALRSFWIQLKVMEQSTKGVRMKDMPQTWFHLSSREDFSNGMTAVLLYLRANYLIDQKHLSEASKFLDWALGGDFALTQLHRRLMICDQIYLALILGQGGECVQSFLDKEQLRFMKQMANYPTVLRTQYALARLWDGDEKQAEKLLRFFRKRSRKYPYRTDIQSEEELIRLADAVHENHWDHPNIHRQKETKNDDS